MIRLALVLAVCRPHSHRQASTPVSATNRAASGLVRAASVFSYSAPGLRGLSPPRCDAHGTSRLDDVPREDVLS